MRCELFFLILKKYGVQRVNYGKMELARKAYMDEIFYVLWCSLLCSMCSVRQSTWWCQRTNIHTTKSRHWLPWSNFKSKYVSRHLSESSSHHDNVRASERFLGMQETGKADIVGQLSSYHQEVIERNCHILGDIIKAFLFCARQNIAIRGRTGQLSCLTLFTGTERPNFGCTFRVSRH